MRVSYLGLSIEDTRDGGHCEIDEFSIVSGKEAEAGRDILTCLANGFEIILRNDLDAGNEGYTSLRGSGSGFEMMIGGHGWRGGWKPVEEREVLMTVEQLAELNRGRNVSGRGSIIRERLTATS